jgi:hypothetical protein
VLEPAPHHLPAPSRSRARLFRLGLVGFGLFVGWLVSEAGLRRAQGYPLWPPLLPEPYVDNAILYRTTPGRLYELRPGVDQVVGRNHVRIRINSAGLRDDREYPVPKPPGVRRLVVLGDSYMFAGKVPLQETFPKRLEARLNQGATASRYEVLNLAVPGYNSWQQRQSLEERGLAFEPDQVLVSFVLNDAVPPAQLVPLDARVPLPLRKLLKRFVTVQVLAAGVKRLPVLLAGQPFKGGSEAALLAEGTPGWESVQEALLGIQALAARAGAGLLVAVWPMMEGLDTGYPFAAQHALVARFCEAHAIPVLDLLPAFAGARPEALWVARDDHHPNGEALLRAVGPVSAALADPRLPLPPP